MATDADEIIEKTDSTPIVEWETIMEPIGAIAMLYGFHYGVRIPFVNLFVYLGGRTTVTSYGIERPVEADFKITELQHHHPETTHQSGTLHEFRDLFDGLIG